MQVQCSKRKKTNLSNLVKRRRRDVTGTVTVAVTDLDVQETTK